MDSLTNFHIVYGITIGGYVEFYISFYVPEPFYFSLNLDKQSYTFKGKEYPIIDSMKISNTTYYNVISIEDDTLSNTKIKIYKVIIAKNYGIVEFCQRMPYKEWVYVPDE